MDTGIKFKAQVLRELWNAELKLKAGQWEFPRTFAFGRRMLRWARMKLAGGRDV